MRNGQNITVDSDLLLDFFLRFARFEYALKITGFARRERRLQLMQGLWRADPDWNRYAMSIEPLFDRNKSPELNEAVGYMWENPPYMEVISSRGELSFESPPYDIASFDFIKLITFVRQVRNHLFHGGKQGSVGDDANTARTEKLLKSSLIILEACLDLNADVKKNYDEAVI